MLPEDSLCARSARSSGEVFGNFSAPLRVRSAKVGTEMLDDDIMSDTGDDGTAAYTPSSSEYNNCSNSSAGSPLPVQELSALSASSSRRTSRTIVPQPAKPTDTDTKPRLSIATVSIAQHAAGPSPSGGGPTAKFHVIPPRPKPGRKPATDEPQTKRKAQNRESQRNFRKRKQEKVEELTKQVETAAQLHRDEKNTMLSEMEALRNQVKHLERLLEERTAERDYWKVHHDELHGGKSTRSTVTHPAVFGSPAVPQYDSSSMMSPHGGQDTPGLCGRCRPEHCQCLEDSLDMQNSQDPPYMEAVALPRRGGTTPMEGVQGQMPKVEDSSELETDFTAAFASAQSRTELDFNIDGEHQTCGFCTSPDNCLCRDSSLRSSGDDLTPLSEVTSATSVSSIPASAPAFAKGPGSCADCQANPQQRAWCQRVAQLRGEATPSLSRRNSARSNSLHIMEPKAESTLDRLSHKPPTIPGIRSVGCTDAYKLFDGRVPMDADHPEWKQLRPIQPQSTPQDSRRDTIMSMEPGTYSAMELDAGSILTALQHARGPLEPRASDGPHATIVEKAEELRRASDSPYAQAQDHKSLSAVPAYEMDTSQ